MFHMTNLSRRVYTLLWDQRVTPQHAWTINSLWLLKYEAAITSSQSVAHLLKPSLGDAFVTSAYYRELKLVFSFKKMDLEM